MSGNKKYKTSPKKLFYQIKVGTIIYISDFDIDGNVIKNKAGKPKRRPYFVLKKNNHHYKCLLLGLTTQKQYKGSDTIELPEIMLKNIKSYTHPDYLDSIHIKDLKIKIITNIKSCSKEGMPSLIIKMRNIGSRAIHDCQK